MSKIRIFLVEDDPKWLKGLSYIIEKEKDFLLIGNASTKTDAVQLIKHLDIDVVLMDIMLSGNRTDGITATEEILQYKKVKIIMLTSLEDGEIIREAITAGAVNYVIKSNYEEIPQVVREAYNNQTSIHRSSATIILKELTLLNLERQKNKLTPTEKEVLALIYKGKNRNQIATLFSVSVFTIKNHIHNALKKMNAKNAKDLAKLAKQKGFLEEYIDKIE